jgi:hypothetical protein
MQIALSVNETGANHTGERMPVRENVRLKKAGNKAGSSCSVVLRSPFVQSVPKTVAVPRNVAESAVTARDAVIVAQSTQV